MIDEYIEYYYLVPVGTILILAMMYAINNWDASFLEKKLITNFKKLQILVSTIFLETIVMFVLVYIFMIIRPGAPEIYILNNDGTKKILPFLLSLFIMSLSTALILNIVLHFSLRFLSVKYYYYVNLENLEGKWYLKRKSNKNQILLKNEKGDHVFLNEWNELIFKQELVTLNKLQIFLYTNKKRTKRIIITLLLSAIILYSIVFLGGLSSTENLILQTAGLILMLISMNIYMVRKYVFDVEQT